MSSVMQPEAEEAAPAVERSGTCQRLMIAGGEMTDDSTEGKNEHRNTILLQSAALKGGSCDWIKG